MYKISQQSSHRYIDVSTMLKALDSSIGTAFIRQRTEAAKFTENPARQFAIAAVVLAPGNEHTFLAVKRPANARSLPNVWGLPAIIVKYNEQPEAAAARLALEKLNTRIEFLGCLGLDSIDRGEYELVLMDIVVRLTGKEPSVWEAPTEQTKYVQQQWTNDLSLLQEAALKGSICSRILLHSQGVTY